MLEKLLQLVFSPLGKMTPGRSLRQVGLATLASLCQRQKLMFWQVVARNPSFGNGAKDRHMSMSSLGQKR